MKIGVNCHPTHWPVDELPDVIADLLDLGIFGVRFPVWLGNEDIYRTFSDLCLASGIEVLPVLDGSAFTLAQRTSRNYKQGVAYWKGQLPNLTRWQIGNEPDQHGGSSWFLQKPTFQKLLADALTVWAPAQLVAAGLVHVDFSYLPLVPAGISRGLHPYAQTGASVGALIDACGGPLPICTEFGSDEPNEPTRAAWFSNMIIGLHAKGIAQAYVYCYSRRQCGVMGLVEVDGTPTQSYAAVKDAIPNVGP